MDVKMNMHNNNNKLRTLFTATVERSYRGPFDNIFSKFQLEATRVLKGNVNVLVLQLQ